jgi:CHAT domain-containing protein/Tfp pilus assembly protein PilF
MVAARGVQAQEVRQAEIRVLLPNQAFERTLNIGETHSYKIKLKAGDYFHVDVEQRGVDVQLTLIAMDGRMIARRDLPNGTNGMEYLSFITNTTEEYRLDVTALAEKATGGKYWIKAQMSRLPTQSDKEQVEAETTLQEGLQLIRDKTIESTRRACAKDEISAGLWGTLANKSMEAMTQTTLGFCRQSLGENQEAIIAHQTALLRYREVKDRGGEAAALSRLSLLNADLAKLDSAIDEFHQATAVYRELQDAEGEKQLRTELASVANGYMNSGFDLFKAGDEKSLRRALAAFTISREVFEALADTPDETLMLIYLGRVNEDLGEKQKALEYYSRALPLLRAGGDKTGEATILNNLGSVYDSLGEKQKALGLYNEALVLFRAEKDQSGEGAELNNIGKVYSDLGDNQQALSFLNQALVLRRKAGDKPGEANTLNNIGAVYDDLGEKQRALEYYRQALPLRRASADKVGEAVTLSNIGLLHNDLGENQKALDYYNQALRLVRIVGDRTGQARILNNIGKIYDDLRDRATALNYYGEALPLWQSVEDKSGQARTLNNIGALYRLSDGQKALSYYLQSLALFREIGDKSGEAATLNNIGITYDDIGNNLKALDSYIQALPLLKAVGDKSGEAGTLHNMMFAWDILKNPRLAIFFGKLSVNSYQHLRLSTQELDDNESQKSFLKSVEYTYRLLANLLIKQGRLTEAQQVLNGFKDQQYFDFNRATLKKPSMLGMTPREADLASRYDSISAAMARIGSRIEEIRLGVGNGELTAEQSRRVEELENDLRNASSAFQATIKEAEVQFGGRPDPVKDQSPNIDDTREMQRALISLKAMTKQNAVAIYTLVSESDSSALIITQGDIIPVNLITKGIDLNEKAREFLKQLSDVDKQTRKPRFSVAEVQTTGRVLYDAVFEPIEVKLKELHAKPDVLMWYLDGGLRYVPVAAFYDGQQYLGERYRNVVFTRADPKRMLSPVSERWTGTGFYNSKEYSIPVNGEMKTFPELENARSEVETIFGVPPAQGVITGKVVADEQFTKESLLEALRQHRPLVHIASHFRLVPGDASASFLLLGKGDKLTLAEIKENPDDIFENVELLTLSACETGVQKERADGREIDSFAELAQRKSAQAILASLWNVDDKSTSGLMIEFYRNRQRSKLTKVEALQKAQLSLLRDSRYSHPFYWSPFILIGNWR